MKIEIKHLSKRYGSSIALDNLTMCFDEGIYGILGANGAGKSTLMNLLTDNLKRDGGQILIDGQEILSLGARYRQMLGYMPQQQGYYDSMTTVAFLCYIAELKQIPKKQAREQIDKLLNITNLSHVKRSRISSLSGGMKQRLLLTQALLGNPRIVILDEPTAGLDPKERVHIRNFISSISRSKIILLATHIVSDIELIADQIILMKKGRVMKIGAPDELTSGLFGKVKDIPCDALGIDSASLISGTMDTEYRIANVYRFQGKTYIRAVGDVLPAPGSFVNGPISLEDVYMYYAGG